MISRREALGAGLFATLSPATDGTAQSRDDAEAVIGGQAEQGMGALDRLLQPGLAERGAVRATERARVEHRRRPAGRLGAGAGGKEGTRRQGGGTINQDTLLTESTRRVGTAWPATALRLGRRMASRAHLESAERIDPPESVGSRFSGKIPFIRQA